MNQSVFEQKYNNLNAKQKEAVDTIYGPVMVIAGPGTGKTTVLTLRIANILKQTDAKPDEILALTFTDSGVRAMREKLRELIGDVSFRVNIFTFHAFANQMRSLYPECFEKIGGRAPASTVDQIEIIEELLENNSFRELRISTYGVKVRDIASRISELKRENIDCRKLLKLIVKEEKEFTNWQEGIVKMNKTRETEIERKEKYINRLKEFARVFELYESALEKKSLYDYDDTILGLIDALSHHKDMLVEVRESFQFVLADEHQDANGSQNEILRFFRDDDSPDPPNIFVVGDDKQSIFRFQGANLENFYNFETEFPQARRIDLNQNYRSQRLIIDSAHHLISSDGREHTKLLANTSHEEKHIEINEFETFADELQYAARSVEKFLKTSSSDETIAILAHNNNELRELATYLNALGLGYSLAGEQSLFENFEYKKITTLFEAILDPLNSPKLQETLFFGYFKIDLHDALLTMDTAKRKRVSCGSIFLKGEFKDGDFYDKKGMLESRRIIKSLAEDAHKKPLLELLKILNKELNIASNTEAFSVLQFLFEEAGKIVIKNRRAMLADFVEHLSRIERHNIAPLIVVDARQSQVKLSTIHKSKGLEYDYVFTIDVTDKKFEKNGRRNDPLRIPGIGVERDTDEERRLLYVAITRAKKQASLSFALCGSRDETTVPSALLDELDPNLLERNVPQFEPIGLLSEGARISKDAKNELREVFLNRPFSVTALNNFLECPWKYVLRNLLLIPDVKGWNALLGTACHRALQRFHLETRRGHILSEIELKKIVKESVEAEAFSKHELVLALEKAEENVLSYAKCYEPQSVGQNIYIEESLNFPLKVRFEKSDFEILITGKIDLAVEESAEVEVIDFKTKKRMTRNAILGETKSDDGGYIRQLHFYKFLWENARLGEKVEKASLIFLSPEKGKVSKETFEISEQDKESIEKLTKETLISIYNFDFLDKGCGEKDCEFCELSKRIEL